MASNHREDPYFVVRDDVNDSLDKVEVLLKTFKQKKSAGTCSESELAEIAKDLKNSIRSIEWDLEDLQETVSIVEKAPSKFRLTSADVAERRHFISQVKQQVSALKSEMSGNQQNRKKAEKQSLLGGSAQQGSYTAAGSTSSAHESNNQFFEDTRQQQELLIHAQDEQIDNIGASVKVLKNISSQIGNELEEQAVLLDDFGHEMNNTGTKMDSTMKKIAKVTRMSNDRRQWCAIGVLIVIVLILIVLISVL